MSVIGRGLPFGQAVPALVMVKGSCVMVACVHRRLLLSTILAGAVAAPLAAQTKPPTTAAATVAATGAPDASEIVVTGSIFRRTDLETPSPVTVLSADTLAKAGITNIADAVRSISADNSGSVPTAFTGGFGAGAAGVSLRGLTVNSTLTLIDGLRTAYYPLADDGQRSFVDLNTIPNEIIDRIEVLKDGASSTYGADAIGGVVNIILKKEFQGIAGLAESGIYEHKDADEQRLSVTAGYGRLATEGFNIYINAEYQRNSAINARDRGFPYNTADLTSIGGDNNNPGSQVPGSSSAAIVAPTSFTQPGNILSGTGLVSGPWQVLNPAGCPAHLKTTTADNGVACEQNTAGDYTQIQPAQERYGVNVHGAVQLGPDAQAYVSVGYNQSNVTTVGVPSSIRAVNPINSSNIYLPALLSNGQLNPNNPFAAAGQPAAIRYLFGDIPFSSIYKNHVIRGAAGVNGSFGEGWTYSADITAAHSWLDITQRGYLNVAGLTAAINDGTYNFVDPSQNSAAIRNQIAPTVVASPSTDLDMIQGNIAKEVFQLPGGPLQIGVGGSIRYEKVNNPNQNPNNATLGLNAVSAVGSRTVSAAFFEINAPILKQFEINGSGRYDHYSDGYGRFSPKIGAKFTPFKQLAIRGTYSKGFRAPSFAETNGSVVGFTSTKIPCSAQAQHGATINEDGTCSGGSSYNQSYSIGFNNAGTPGIKPEKSRSFTAGVVFEPAPWINLTVDYYNIKKTDIISGGPLANDALDAYYAGTALPAGYTITTDSVDPTFPAGIRRALFVNAPYANAAALKTSGIDFGVNINLPVTDRFRISSRVDVTDILDYKFKSSATSDYVDYVGTQAPYITSSGAGTPKWRGSWQLTGQYDKFTLSATTYFVSAYKAVAVDQFGGSDCATSSTYQGSDPNFNCQVKHFIYGDLVGSYDVTDKFTAYFNVVNLTDEKAPLNAGNYAATNYNPTYTQVGAVGRTYRVGVRFRY